MDWARVGMGVFDAMTVGAVSGAAIHLIFSYSKKTYPKWLPVLLVFGVFEAWSMNKRELYKDTHTGSLILDRVIPEDPYNAAERRFKKQLMALPGAADRFAGLSPEEAKRVGYSLSLNGMKRLPFARLEERMVVVGSLVELGDDQLRAAMYYGESSNINMIAYLRKLPLPDYEAYLELILAAAAAELAQVPEIPQPTYSSALQVIINNLPQEDGDRLLSILNAKRPTPENASWAVRVLYREGLKLTAPHRGEIARLLTGV